MANTDHILIFSCENLRLAIQLAPVERVIRAVKVNPVPNSPAIIHGIINDHGRILPVINLRARLGLALKPVKISDRFIIVNIPGRRFAFVADEVSEIDLFDIGSYTESEEIVAGVEAKGILKRKDGLVLIYEIDKFFPLSDANLLSELIKSKA